MQKIKRVKLTSPPPHLPPPTILYNSGKIDTTEYHSASSVHNYVLNDPILDVFKYTTLYPNEPEPNEDSFVKILFEQGAKFESEIIKLLSRSPYEIDITTISTSRDETLLYETYEKTIKALKNGNEFIYQGTLHTQDPNFPFFGTPDIIAKIKVLRKFIKNFPISKEYDEYYTIVDIKNSSIKFKSDNSNMLSTGRMKANSCQVSIYYKLLKQLDLNVFNGAFILGRSCSLMKDDCFYKLGYVSDTMFTESYFSEIADWLSEVKSGTLIRKVYPNMCNQYDTPYNKLKRKIAKTDSEITSIYRISYTDRERLINSGVYKWTDKNFITVLQESDSKYYKSDLLKNIIYVQNAPVPIKLDNLMLKKFQDNNSSGGRYFIDIERTTNMISDFTSLPSTYKPTYTFMLGIYCDEYYSFIKYNDANEENIYERAIQFIENHAKNNGYNNYKLYHWGQIEKTYIKKALPDYDTSNMCDLYTEIIGMNFAVKDAFSYSIKDIANAMLSNGLIDYTPETGNMNGQMAAVLAEIYYSESHPEEKYMSKIDDILKYNKQDCIMLERIFKFLYTRIIA
jgi:hypothetical protein